MKKIYAIINSAKFKTFNKTKPMTKKVAHRRLDIRLAAAQGLDNEEKVRELINKHVDQLEEEINKMKENKYGGVTNVFKMRELVSEPKN